jgi:hypothetical protein
LNKQKRAEHGSSELSCWAFYSLTKKKGDYMSLELLNVILNVVLLSWISFWFGHAVGKKNKDD